MEKELVRAYLAHEVIRTAFSPTSDSEKAGWLAQYHRTLAGFWEVACMPSQPRAAGGALEGSIPQSPADVSFDYSIHGDKKFSLRLLHGATCSGQGLMWTHESDPDYYDFPHSLALTKIKLRSMALGRNGWDDSDIEAVVDGLVCHPRTHIHIEQPAIDHSLRLGASQGNGFLFLFHLRYQACMIQEKRIEERRRLCGVFSHAIKSKVKQIPASTLFGQA